MGHATDWDEPAESDLPSGLLEIAGDRLVAQVLARRGIDNPGAARSFLDPEQYIASAPDELPGLQAAVERLQLAARRGEAVCVWGDFDVDGQTATTLLVEALDQLGTNITYHIPVRARESHGINLPELEKVLDSGVQLVLTCDTGISAHEAAEYARQRGVDMLISDHHDLPRHPHEGEKITLPNALAIVNPKLLPANHPLATLPGVGVAYKLAEALFAQAGDLQAVTSSLDLAALGIVADLAVLKADTRYLLQRGLQQLRQNQRLGLQLMCELANLDPSQINEEHIGYLLGPRMNAIGRLGDANPVVELLTTRDRERAYRLAQDLEVLNSRRKLLTDQVFQAAMAAVEREPALLDDPVLVLSHPEWPAGVIGIVASRLVEHFHRPTVLIAAPAGEPARGSARSVDGINITAALAENADQLIQFGGHPMAAGLAILPENIPGLRRRLGRSIERQSGGLIPSVKLVIDAELPLPDLTPELVAGLESLAPFGPGNPPVVLISRTLRMVSYNTVGQNDEHLIIDVEDQQGRQQRVIWWQGAGWPLPDGWFDLAYRARSSSFRGRPEMQVTWVAHRPAAQAGLELAVTKPAIRVVDQRGQPHPLAVLHRLEAQESVQIWGEASAVDTIMGRDRYELQPARTLAIWTTPPGPTELKAALAAAAPLDVVLFAIDPGLDAPEAFLKRLTGLLKYIISANHGKTTIQALAAATAQREITVMAGVEWLVARGFVQILGREQSELILENGNGQPKAELEQSGRKLRAMLDETRAYRSYFRRAAPEYLIE